MVDVPAVEVVVPLVFVIARSAAGASVSESVAELLNEIGSVVPVGTVIVAVLASAPVAEALTVAVRM